MKSQIVLSRIHNFLNRNRRSWKRIEAVFSKAYYKNSWCSRESASGTGSEIAQAQILIEELPRIFRRLNVQSVLDLPCGDFHWMQKVDLTGIRYLGGDVVNPIVKYNQRHFSSPGREFFRCNLISDHLPSVDLIFTRDCLVHLSFKDTVEALRNICRTDAKYFATTTFPSSAPNTDISTGGWRMIDLETAPFCFPPPLILINEQCTEVGGMFRAKSIGIWRIHSLRALAAMDH